MDRLIQRKPVYGQVPRPDTFDNEYPSGERLLEARRYSNVPTSMETRKPPHEANMEMSSLSGVSSHFTEEPTSGKPHLTAEAEPDHQAWQPGQLRLLPWTGLLCLFVAILCVAAAITILRVSDGKPANWTVEPSVLLAIITPLSGILIAIALLRGTEIVWWSKAIEGNCSVQDLSRNWEFGNSFFAALLAGRHVNAIAIAKIFATASILCGPLLQRASTIQQQDFSRNVTLRGRIATDVNSFAIANYSSSLTDAFGDPVQLSPTLTQVMKDYSNRASIHMNITGCEGVCSATIEAAGISAECQTHNQNVSVSWDNGGGNVTKVFQSGFNVLGYQEPNKQFNWTSFAASTTEDTASTLEGYSDCSGTSIVTKCQLQHAVVSYPVTITNSTLITLNFTASYKLPATNIEPVGSTDNTLESYSERVFSGLSLATTGIFTALSTTEANGPHGFRLNATGALSSNYWVNGSPVYCALAYEDPTNDVLNSMNELMFRIAISASTDSLPLFNTSAVEHSSQNVYRSHSRYMAGGIAVMLAGIIAVLPTFWGWWIIGRKVSLNPIETAKAFNAPVLQAPRTSNSTLAEIVERCGELRVQYGEILVGEGDRYIKGQDQMQHSRLGFESVEKVRRPKPGTFFQE